MVRAPGNTRETLDYQGFFAYYVSNFGFVKPLPDITKIEILV
jgi:hypothetical protein